MSDLVKYQALPVATLAELSTMGQMLAQTGMFGTNNPAEGFVIAALCHQSGMTFIEYMQTYHLIKGKVSKRADAIQADFQRGGGKVKVVQRDAAGAVVELTKDGNGYTSTCLWADCLQEPFIYEGKESDVVNALNGNDPKAKAGLRIKAKYATPRSRMQMLWARAISDGIRAVDPVSVQGSYTPEEIGDLDDPRAPHEPVRIAPEEAAKRAESLQAQTAAAAPAAPAAAPAARAIPKGEETPFDMIDRPPATPDCSTCPVAGQMFGKAWASMETAHLKMALGLTNPEFTPGHRQAIQDEFNKRGGAA